MFIIRHISWKEGEGQAEKGLKNPYISPKQISFVTCAQFYNLGYYLSER
jgi:hypothetical protein